MFRRSLAAAALAAALVISGGISSASADDATPVDPYLLQIADGTTATNPTTDATSDDGKTRGSADTSGGKFRTQGAAGAAGYSVSCTGQIQDPHYSKGAGGAIAKVDITCKGSGVATVTVNTKGLLQFAPSSSPNNTKVTFSNRATSEQAQTIAVNGPAKTYYLPKVGSNGGRGTGFWRTTFTWQITSLPNATVGSDTKTIYKTI